MRIAKQMVGDLCIGIVMYDDMDNVVKHIETNTYEDSPLGQVYFTGANHRFVMQFLDNEELSDVVFDLDDDIHIKPYYDDLIPGIHLNLEFMDNRNCVCDSIVMVDDLCRDFYGTIGDAICDCVFPVIDDALDDDNIEY